MFERFTSEAREVVVGAQREARTLRSRRVGTEHLLLGLLAQPGTTSARLLVRHGITRQVAVEAIQGLVGDDLDADALTTLGIDLGAVRERVEEAFGPGALDDPSTAPSERGHVPFTARAKKVLELSLREALAMKSRTITDGHILLGLLREGAGLAMKVLHDRGVDVPALRDDLRLLLNS